MQSPLKIEDVRKILGYKHGGSISRAENQKARPSFEMVVAYQILFGVSPEELCPGIFDGVRSKMKTGIQAVTEELRYQSEVEGEGRRRYFVKQYEAIRNDKTAD